MNYLITMEYHPPSQENLQTLYDQMERMRQLLTRQSNDIEVYTAQLHEKQLKIMNLELKLMRMCRIDTFNERKELLEADMKIFNDPPSA